VIATQRSVSSSSSPVVLGTGLALVGVYVGALTYLMQHSTWDMWGGMLIGPVLFVATLPALARQAKREGDGRVFRLLVAALVVKMLVSLLRYHHGFNLGEGSDAQAYDRIGTEIAGRFIDGNFNSGLPNIWDSNWIRFFTASIYTVIRPSVISGYLIYAWLAFWGTFFFYRAFVLAVPEGNRRSYARWLFFMPSMLFWPSSIGKESWMTFGLGIAAFGAAKMVRGRFVPGALVSAIGIALAALVRAPVAALFGIATVTGCLLRRSSHQLRQLAPVAKLASAALLVGGAFVLLAAMRSYFVRSGLGTDVDKIVSESLRLTSTGGSEFTPASTSSPVGIFVASITVLFRPFIFEAHTIEAAAISIEGLLLLLFSIARFRSFLAAARGIREFPYVAVAILYVAGSILGLASIANFGILARQRTLLFPMYLVLMCFLPSRRTTPRMEPSSSEAAAAFRGGPK
jgi:hypothetical protein